MYAEGALALLLRLFCWAVPLRASRSRSGWRFHAAPLSSLQAIGMTILNAAIILGVILDFFQEPEKRLRIGTTFLQGMIWISEVVLVMGIASLTVYSGPSRVKCLKKILEQLRQINLDFNISSASPKTETNKSVVMVLLLVWIVVIMIMDFYFWYPESVKNGTMCILYLQASFYIGNLLWWLTVLRWTLMVEVVHEAAVTVNCRLQSLVLGFEAVLKPEPNAMLREFLSKPHSIGTLIAWISDPDMTLKTQTAQEKSTFPPQVKVMIRRLVLSHERIGEIMKQMNETNGLLLIIILMATFLKLVVTPYYMLKNLLDETSNVAYNMVLSLNWSLSIFVILLLTIEPCHRLHLQRERTEVLLSQLTHVAPSSQLSKDLELFTKHVELNKQKLTPLGIYTLDRPLMAMMLSSITTYLVIIIEFLKLSHKHN